MGDCERISETSSAGAVIQFPSLSATNSLSPSRSPSPCRGEGEKRFGTTKMENPALVGAGVSVTLRTLGTSVVVGVSIVIPHLFASFERCCSSRSRSGIRVHRWLERFLPTGCAERRSFSDRCPASRLPPLGWSSVLQVTLLPLLVVHGRLGDSTALSASVHGSPPVGGFCLGDRVAVAERAASPKSPCPWAWRASKPMYHGSR